MSVRLSVKYLIDTPVKLKLTPQEKIPNEASEIRIEWGKKKFDAN